MDQKNITIIRSYRKTISIEVKPGGLVIVRAPQFMSEADILKFVDSREDWIRKAIMKTEAAARERAAKPQVPRLSSAELKALADKALKVIPERVAYYAPIVGVTYGRITIRNQRSRWGSCTSRGNLNFNCLLMLTPPEVVDSVVVHELCHRLEMNHSDRFYAHVFRVYPEYRKWNKWLKDNGAAIMRRMTG